MSHSKHRQYKVLSNTDNYSMVQLASGTESAQKCFLLDHEVGELVYLYERETNIFTGYIMFEYSLLNLFEVGKKYTFNIVDEMERVLIISNHKHIQLAIPISFKEEENQEKIELEVSELLLDTNKVLFKEKEVENKTLDLSDFEEGQEYEVDIVDRYINKNDNEHIVVSYNSKEYHIYLPPNFACIDLGDKISVHLVRYDSGDWNLQISRSSIVKKVYKTKEKYKFTIEEEKISTRNGMMYWRLKDEHGLINNYHPEHDITYNNSLSNLKKGDSLELYVYDIYKNGFLDLVYEIKDWDSTDYLAEELFAAIGYEDQEEEYFFKYFSQFREDDTEQEVSFDEQYNQGNNLWVFSYLAFLDSEILRNLEEAQYFEAKTFIDIYIKIEKWILEGSDYLNNFSKYKAGDIIQKAESKINKLQATERAMDIYLKGEDQDFIESIQESLSRTPYLNPEKKNTFKEIVKLSQYFSSDTEDTTFHKALILIIQNGYLSDEDRWSFMNSIEAKLYRLRDKVSEYNISSANVDKNIELNSLISNQYLLVMLSSMTTDDRKSNLSSIYLLRYLSIYHNDIRYIDLSLRVLISQSYLAPNALLQTNVFDLSIESLENMLKQPEIEPSIYRSAGRIIWTQNGIDLIPKNFITRTALQKQSLIYHFDEFNITINSYRDVKPLSLDQEIQDVVKDVSSLISYQNKSDDVQITEADILDKYYYGRVKSITNEFYGFLVCDIDGIEKESLYHINTFHRCLVINDISEILKVGDIIKFKVIKVEEDKIHISSSDVIEDFAEKIMSDIEKTTAVVVYNFDSTAKLISEEGFPLIIFETDLVKGDIVEVEIDDYNIEFQNFIVSDYKVVSKNFLGNPAELYRGFLKNAGLLTTTDSVTYQQIIEANSTLVKNEFLLEDNPHLKTLVNILIYSLEQRLNYIKEPIDLIKHYFLIIVVSGIIKSHKSFIYNQKLNHLIQIIKLQYSEEIDLLDTSLPDQSFGLEAEELRKESQAFDLIKFINRDVLDIPLEIDKDSQFYMLKKMIESYNLMQVLNIGLNENTLLNLKKAIVKELYNITLKFEIENIKGFESVVSEESEQVDATVVKKVITNLGSESKEKEFKSSIFYSASDTPQSSVIMKTIAGFLNSYEFGGSLFIGVDDSGEVIGLEKDLKYSSEIRNLDQYQNHIQSLVVAAFPNEINARLDYKFHRVNNLDYLEIIIPSHSKPIPFENEFYQRQGVQTRRLRGEDLTDFMMNKLQGIQPSKLTKKDGVGLVNYESIKNQEDGAQLQLDMNSTNEIDFYSDLKKDGEVQKVKYEVNEDDLLAYFYIFKNDTYKVSSSELPNYEFKIPITEKYRFGHILMCYDNACVNKVEVRSIINKSFNKEYKNAKSTYGNLMTIYKSLPGDQILVETKRFDKTYLKIFEVDKITEHRGVGLKGNCIVQDDFDKVNRFYHTTEIPESYDYFRRESKQGLGGEIDRKKDLYHRMINLVKA